jgi:hypothetical protein
MNHDFDIRISSVVVEAVRVFRRKRNKKFNKRYSLQRQKYNSNRNVFYRFLFFN